MRLMVIALAAAFVAVPLAGQGQEVPKYVSDAGMRWNVPVRLLVAIMRQESGGRPWAVNVAGIAHQPGSRGEALEIIRDAQAAGKSFDVGLMQINSTWIRRLNLPPEYALEPVNNVFIGAWILSQEIARHGLGWRAVASYHTPVDKNPDRGRRYALAVIEHLWKLP